MAETRPRPTRREPARRASRSGWPLRRLRSGADASRPQAASRGGRRCARRQREAGRRSSARGSRTCASDHENTIRGRLASLVGSRRGRRLNSRAARAVSRGGVAPDLHPASRSGQGSERGGPLARRPPSRPRTRRGHRPGPGAARALATAAIAVVMAAPDDPRCAPPTRLPRLRFPADRGGRGDPPVRGPPTRAGATSGSFGACRRRSSPCSSRRSRACARRRRRG